MPRVRIVDHNRGGFRTKKRLRNSQAMLLDELISLNGGPAEFAAKLDVNPQAPINWRNKGFVPPKMLGKIAKAFKITPWALNFSFLASLAVAATPEWETIVHVTLDDKDVIAKVLKGKHPNA